MLGNISAGRLCRSACFEFVSQTSSTHRLKEDLEPLLALPAPHAPSCLSADRVQNATWEAAAPAERRGGPGQEGLGDPSPRQLEAEPPDHSASSRKPQGSQKLTREHRLTGGGDQPGVATLIQWRRLDGDYGGRWWFSFWNLSQPDLPVAPDNIHSKYRPLSLKYSFRTCVPDTHGQHGDPAASLCLSQVGRLMSPLSSSLGRILQAGSLESTRK